ncbi:hypothetical protein PAMA_011284 [Pampus argenteus]
MQVESQEERSVEVLALPEDVDEELLYLYFENKRRSGGGPLVSVEMKGDHALLVFEEAETAARVLSKEHHVLHNVELSLRKPVLNDRYRLLLCGINPNTSTEMIELYVENMIGLNLNDYTLHPLLGRDLVLIHLRQPFSKDLQKLQAKLSMRPLDGATVTLEQIKQTDSILVENLHPGTTSDMLTLYFESKRGGDQKVKEVTMLSKGTARVSFVNYESVDPVLNHSHKLDDAELIVKPYYDFLQPAESTTSLQSGTESTDVTVKDSEDISDIQMQTSPPRVVSANSHADVSHTPLEPLTAPEAVEEISEEVMEDQQEDINVVSSHIAVPDPAKLALFQPSTFLQDIEKTHPDFTVQIGDNGVHITGPDSQRLEQIKSAILDFFATVAEVQFTLEPEMAQLLLRKDVKERLLQTMNQSGSPTWYTVSDCNVAVMSLSQNLANQACSFIKSQLCQFSIPIDKEYECMLYSREWSEFLQVLGFSSVSEQDGNIDVLTLKGMEGEKQIAILEFLTTPIEKEVVISMEPGMLKYIQIHCHQLLADMDQVSIFPLEAEDVCGLKIHGHAGACQMAEEVLQGVVSSICTRTITVNAPGVARFLCDEECKSILKQMETKFQVYIIPKQMPWKPLPDQDIFETGWKMMSSKNFQKVSSVKSDAMQTDVNGAKDLLDEAKKIVSAIEERLQESPTNFDPQDDMDDVDLYTAEAPTSLSDQTSDTTAVNASQPLAEENATGGLLLQSDEDLGLSNDLEEEAQLSLAIQYSMESSHISLEDEEQQLQKALELSRSMIEHERSSSGTDKTPQVDQPKKGSNSFLQDAINTIQIHVFAGYNSDLIRVDIALGKKVSQRQVNEKLEHRSVKNMSEYHKKCLELIKRKHAVEIQVVGTIITVSGFKDYVAEAMSDTKLLLEKISNSITDEEILRTIQWVQHDPDTSDTTPYSPDATVFIENACRMKLKKVDILLNNQPHIINFEKMEQCNTSSGKSVKISRKLLGLGDLEGDIPVEEYSLLSNLPEATKLDEESDEFQNVVKNFYETIQEYHSKIRIIQVEKLMNRLLYNQYKLKKASIIQRAMHPEIERTLYHGTSETSVKEICIHGFNRSFCGKNGMFF